MVQTTHMSDRYILFVCSAVARNTLSCDSDRFNLTDQDQFCASYKLQVASPQLANCQVKLPAQVSKLSAQFGK